MGRMEILTGVERRRNWSDEEKLQILEEAAAEGANIAEIGRRHDIRAQQIYTWRRKFAARRDEPSVSFLPVALISSDTGSEPERTSPMDKPAPLKRSARPSRIEIGCKGGRVLKVDCGIAPDLLKALIRSVEEA